MSGKGGKSRGLGRGLSALMADVAPSSESADQSPPVVEQTVPIEKLVPNPDQPRRQFDQDDLNDLAASIRDKGIIQPLIVRPSGDDTFEIVAGERRWRAAQMAQLHEAPIIVRDLSDTEVLEIAIIENIQRADLNPVEEAAGYQQLMDRFGHTQEKLGEALGKSRSHIANLLRLLTLPDDVQDHLRYGRLSSGHARALITSDDPSDLARKVISKALSVRATEELVRKQSGAGTKPQKKTASKAEKDADTKALEGDLSANLGMTVSLAHKPGQEAGKVTISYDSLEQLDTLCRLLSAT